MALRFTRSSFHKPGRATVAAAVLGLAAAAALWVSADRWLGGLAGPAGAALSEDLGVPVRVGKLGLAFPFSVAARDVSVGAGVHPSLPETILIERVLMRPSVSLFPAPSLDWHLTFQRPRLAVRATLADVLLVGRVVRDAPLAMKRFGPVRAYVRVGSMRLDGARVILISPSATRICRQDFEGVRAFAGRSWFSGEIVDVSGHAAGDVGADFRLRGNARGASGMITGGDVRFDCRRFATAYLAPHLDERLRLPEGNLTASLRVKLKNGRLHSKGRVAVPRTPGRHPLLRALAFLSPAVRYEVRGEIGRDAWKFSEISVETTGARLKGSGEARWSGAGAVDFSLSSEKIAIRRFGPLVPEVALESGDAIVHLLVRGAPASPALSAEMVVLDASFRDVENRVRVTRLDGRVRWAEGRATLGETWAFVNALPVGVRGFWESGKNARFRLEAFTYPGQIPSLRPKNALNASLSAEGAKTPRGWDAAVRVARVFYREKGVSERAWTVRTEGLLAPSLRTILVALPRSCGVRCARIEWSREETDLGGRVTPRPRALAISDARWVLRADGASLSAELAEGALFGGRAAGAFRTADARKGAWSTSLSVSGADAAAAAEAFGLSQAVRGALAFEGRWVADGRTTAFAGKLRASNLELASSPALERAAADTGIEALRAPRFRAGVAELHSTADGLAVENLKLSGEDLAVTADLTTAHGRVAGRAGVRIRETRIRGGSALKWISRFVGAGEWVDFDFEVAGTPSSPRLRWMPGEFKRKLESRLAPWLRGLLAAEIERRFAEGR